MKSNLEHDVQRQLTPQSFSAAIANMNKSQKQALMVPKA